MLAEGHFLVRRRRSRSLIRGILNEAALPLFELGESRPKAVEGGCFPLQSLLYLCRNEKLSRNNKRLPYSDGRKLSEVFL